ncbi:DUF2974 domain-containing protein [Brooklawnia cerclae]|uniref:Uncharacterized membrane protein HdeD (DUF308 family) n=1 Tax=Brooklawnia cerclae TaxID=349934 RepID=A0ABX0SJM8_9ACTN|nr:Mbeg1-like protein [Brooklawnia cerclae]NIH58588.1 uncharacterized membrane protein HdeD (DUF308 family) [Brooklawnia cerclae]
MANLQDYVRWRGDFTLAEREFNTVDNLVLSALSYLDLDGIVPGPGEGSITLAAASALWRRAPSGLDQRRLTVTDPSLLLDLGDSARFGTAVASDYVDAIDPDSGMQFAALTVRLDDGSAYVAFRGTDNTILGWREDFTMSFQTVPAQAAARDYLRARLAGETGPVRVGGHSKGGNLALYAAMGLPDHLHHRVTTVYNNDGPGLSPQIVDGERVERFQDKIVWIVPEFAVVGMLFNHAAPPRVVASGARGLVQHSLMTWQVEGTDLVDAPGIAAQAGLLNRAFDSLLEDATDDDRRDFTEAFFGALTAGGATLITDIPRWDGGSFESVLFALARSRGRTRRTVTAGARSALRAVVGVDYPALIRQHAAARSLLMVATGLFFIVVPQLAIQLLGSLAVLVICGAIVFRLARYFMKYKERHRMSRPKAVAAGVVTVAALVVLIQIQAFVTPMNLLIGVAFLGNAWSSGKRALGALRRSPRRWPRGVLLFVSAVASLLFGVVALSVVDQVVPFYVLQAGQYCLVVGLVEMFFAARDRVVRQYAHDTAVALWPARGPLRPGDSPAG